MNLRLASVATPICVFLFGICAAAAVASAKSSADNPTVNAIGLIRAAVGLHFIGVDDLQVLYDGVTGVHPVVHNPFSPYLSQAEMVPLHDQFEQILKTGAVNPRRIKNWLAGLLDEQGAHRVRRTRHSDDTNYYNPDIDSPDMRFIRLPPGKITMPKFMYINGDETQTVVSIPEEFEIMDTQFTQGMWLRHMRTAPFFHTTGPDRLTGVDNDRAFHFCPLRPAENVAFDQIEALIEKLNTGNDGYHYRLPTDVEWLYAATNCGNEQNQFAWDSATADDFLQRRRNANVFMTAPDGTGSVNAQRFGWIGDNSNHQTHPVAQLEPMWIDHPQAGPQKIWDLVGNVHELAINTLTTVIHLKNVKPPYYIARLIGSSYTNYANRNGRINPWDGIALENDGAVHPLSSRTYASAHAGFRLVRQRRIVGTTQ